MTKHSPSAAAATPEPHPGRSETRPRSLFDKVWEAHLVAAETAQAPAILYIDLHLIHEVTSPQAFQVLAERGLKVRRPDRTFATIDHSTPTLPAGPDGRRPYANPQARAQVETLEANCEAHGVTLFGWESEARGVVHVMGPELGLTRPGMTVVCGDSHTATHGAFGAIAFGIGTSEVSHVLATQTLLQRRPRSMRVWVDGHLPFGVGAKDLALAIVARLGAAGGSGAALEYAGQAIRRLDMEGRMTVCNMSIEAGARSGLIAPDATTARWLAGRPFAPSGSAFDREQERWAQLQSDADVPFDQEVRLDARDLAPMATFGVSPDAAIRIDEAAPAPADAAARRALDYMRLEPGRPLAGQKVDVVFVGSCTNGRLGDLREAAALLRGRSVAPGVRMIVVPGSERVRREAESEGLHEVFLKAGAEWRLPGCSMCIAMNGDLVEPGQLAVSTSNRNFEGRQGPGARTVLAGPATAAASAVAGAIADPRPFLENAHG